ncbi:DEAD/DEAH box helicase [Sphingobium cloacae]|uniref:hypothetical protein n=1 Tax=Sphingobium cloacae TaxID=120107 RepID=UPI00083093D0|nr:hypothetical protein [Sphingobium cloacae]
MASEPGSSGLIRVATLPDYAVPLGDVQRVIARANTDGVSQLTLLRSPIEGHTPAGADGLQRISRDVAASQAHSAVAFLNAYLFEHGKWLAGYAADDSVRGQQRRLAIYQLLDVAVAYAAKNPRGGISGFLDWVRHLELFGDERQLRAPPAAAAQIDAVRLLTIHASKGLEFAAVHLPALAKTILAMGCDGSGSIPRKFIISMPDMGSTLTLTPSCAASCSAAVRQRRVLDTGTPAVDEGDKEQVKRSRFRTHGTVNSAPASIVSHAGLPMGQSVRKPVASPTFATEVQIIPN